MKIIVIALFPFLYNFFIFLDINTQWCLLLCYQIRESCFSYSVPVAKITQIQISFLLRRLPLLVKNVLLNFINVQEDLHTAALSSFWGKLTFILMFFLINFVSHYLSCLSISSLLPSLMIQVTVIMKQRDLKEKILFCI